MNNQCENFITEFLNLKVFTRPLHRVVKSTCQCSGADSLILERKIPHAVGPLILCAATTEPCSSLRATTLSSCRLRLLNPAHLEPQFHKRNHCKEKACRLLRRPVLPAIEESPQGTRKAQHCSRLTQFFKRH